MIDPVNLTGKEVELWHNTKTCRYCRLVLKNEDQQVQGLVCRMPGRLIGHIESLRLLGSFRSSPTYELRV